MKAIHRLLLMSFLLAFSLGSAADDFKKSHIRIKSENSTHPGRIRVTEIANNYSDSVLVRVSNAFDNQKSVFWLASGTVSKEDITCTVVSAKAKRSSNFIDIVSYESKKRKQSEEKRDSSKVKGVQAPKAPEGRGDESKTPEGKANEPKAAEPKANAPKAEDVKDNEAKTDAGKELPVSTNPAREKKLQKWMDEMLAAIDTIPAYSKEQIAKDSAEMVMHVDNLRGWSDKAAYREKQIEPFIQRQQGVIDSCKSNEAQLIEDLLKPYKRKLDILEQKACKDSLEEILGERIAARENHLQMLKDELEEPSQNNINHVIGVCVVLAIVLICLVLWYRKAAKKGSTAKTHTTTPVSTADSESLVIIGKRATSSLKKQSLDDVYENKAYMKIDCSDFCEDSAVRTMYVKNTCIKDIYNMYAEDLRNPNNPKEDGCLVVGRWVLDDASQQYDVSLEYIVTPGDDAIFAEYELNFGGKIQLKKGNLLKKLRRDTGLQYDLTCWVHSHPGLGVFFSNSDNNVQMQFKNELHPHFLTALVIDILTPEQETGIFTFKPDDTINSKNDLKKMYSLEKMYKWALESERRSFNKDDFYNTLGHADQRINECYGIELSNGAIIDMAFMATSSNGFVGHVHGYPILQGEKQEHIVTAVKKPDAFSDKEMIGCYVVSAHCSIPSIRKIVSQYLDRIRFVLVYTPTDGIVTSIPVQDHDLCNNEELYGEQLLEDLKIWTRRKR